MKSREVFYVVFTTLLVAAVGAVLIMAVGEMPPYGEATNPTNNYVMRRYVDDSIEESGSYNYVTNIILDYRGYDTLLETTVLFTAVMSIIALWGVQDPKE